MAKKSYIGIGGVARNTKEIYIGVNGVARRVNKAYVGVNGVARQCYGESYIPASELEVGSVVKILEDGSPIEYIVVNQGIPSNSSLYDTSCNGTWLLRKDIIETQPWGTRNPSTGANKLARCLIYPWLNSTMLAKYDTNIQNTIKQVLIPYKDGGGGNIYSGANGMSCKLFLLSCSEVGWTSGNDSHVPTDGAKLDYFENGAGATANNKRVAYLNGVATEWWLRTPGIWAENFIYFVLTNGYFEYGMKDVAYYFGVRPAMVVPFNALFGMDTRILKGI